MLALTARHQRRVRRPNGGPRHRMSQDKTKDLYTQFDCGDHHRKRMLKFD